jgi:hypothetical protein
LPQCRPQRQRKAGGVAMQLTLMNDAILMRMQEFDRIFDGENVDREGLVDQINDRRESRRFVRPGRPGH